MPPRKIYGRTIDDTVERAMWSLSRMAAGSLGGRVRSAAPVPKKGPTSSVEPDTAGTTPQIEWFSGTASITSGGTDLGTLAHYDGPALLDYSTSTAPFFVADGIYFAAITVVVEGTATVTEDAFSSFQVVMSSFGYAPTFQMLGTMPHQGAGNIPGTPDGTGGGAYASSSVIAAMAASDPLSVYVTNNAPHDAGYNIYGQVVQLA